MTDCIDAHRFSINNRDAMQRDAVCGCFHCLKIFNTKEISEWISDTSGTAVCPYCGIDAIIGAYSGYPITYDFLEKMHQHWF